jgi:hypothetical protein
VIKRLEWAGLTDRIVVKKLQARRAHNRYVGNFIVYLKASDSIDNNGTFSGGKAAGA